MAASELCRAAFRRSSRSAASTAPARATITIARTPRSPIADILANPTPSRWYDPAAFVEADAGTYGNNGRDTMIEPGIRALDFDAHKEFRMPYREGHLLQFRLEAFNVLNHPVRAAPNGNILAGAAFPGQPATNAHQGFGVISGTAISMRHLQLALKYSF